MKYRKLKRALAMTVAVLMAVPAVNYGGMAEVHAEEAAEETEVSEKAEVIESAELEEQVVVEEAAEPEKAVTVEETVEPEESVTAAEIVEPEEKAVEEEKISEEETVEGEITEETSKLQQAAENVETSETPDEAISKIAELTLSPETIEKPQTGCNKMQFTLKFEKTGEFPTKGEVELTFQHESQTNLASYGTQYAAFDAENRVISGTMAFWAESQAPFGKYTLTKITCGDYELSFPTDQTYEFTLVESEASKEPETPTTPEEPKEPETPTTPEEPKEPETPTTPEEPKEPEAPTTPETPKEPEVSETPATPTVPEQPSAPETAEKVQELNVSVSGIKAQAYTGKAITPKIVVKDNATKKKLKQGKDYTVSFENNVNAGTGTIILTGINGYEGVKRVDFTIQPQNIAKKIKAKVNGKKFRYAGTALTPGVTVTYGKMVLAEGTDYEISYADNSSKGTAKIYIKGNGNYTGTRTVKFKITGPQMKEAEVTLSASSAVYGSADSRPGVTAVYNGKTLTEGTDYAVKYPKTWKPGKNTITIQGKGSFSGSVKCSFTIEKAPMDKVTVSTKNTWQVTGKKLNIVPDSVTLDGAVLVLNKDYTVKYRSASSGKAVSAVKTAGAYQMVLTGKGCYQGTKTVDFTVTNGTAADNTNTATPAAKPETKPETTVTGVGVVVDGLQLVESDIEGEFSTGDHIGQKVKLTATLSEPENREESLKEFAKEVPDLFDLYDEKDLDLSHYDIHCAATKVDGITDATLFSMKIKIDGVNKDSKVYGLYKYGWGEYDRDLGITCYDGYITIRGTYVHSFNPKEIYILIKK